MIKNNVPHLQGLFIAASLLIVLGACTPKKQSGPSANSQLASAIKDPLSPEETEELLGEVGENWLYGQGLGESAATIGTIAVFPPFALWVAGNAIAEFSGYESLKFSDALPDQEREAFLSAYDSVTSAPGRMSAAIAGEEFRSKEVAGARLKSFMEKRQNENKRQ